jgi:phosphate/sulfate permease
MHELLTQIPATEVALVATLLLVLLQEAVNGFHDTANAIAAAVYSNAIEARYAVMMAAALNFVGVMVSGCAVAFAMVYLLPVEMVAGIGTTAEVAFLAAMIVTAVLWNVTTWWLGIPNSTTHTYVGAILGVTAAHAFVNGQSISAHMHWHEGEKVIAALVVSPILGFAMAWLVYRVLHRVLKSDHAMFQPSEAGQVPSKPIRALLIGGAAGISFLHGTNDGQKSIGFMFLVLVGLAPAVFGLDQTAGPEAYAAIQRSTHELETLADALVDEPAFAASAKEMHAKAQQARQLFSRYETLAAIPVDQEIQIRRDLLYLQRDVSRLLKAGEGAGVLTSAQSTTLGDARTHINRLLENVPWWLMALSASFLGLGTAVGYKRIVETLGEKMSSVRMNAAHGTATQITAIACIALADISAVPVSTTHVVTSGVAGSMEASGASLNFSTLRGILITWFTTLPGCFALSFAFSIVLHSAVT